MFQKLFCTEDKPECMSRGKGRSRRVVVKVGSSSVSGDGTKNIPGLIDALALLQGECEVVLVSSGAIATGVPLLQMAERPVDLPSQQAAAAVGQNILINAYQKELDRHGLIAGQVLLTAADFENPKHRKNAQNALNRLLELGIIPVINENDTVATHEIRFGDNDRLAALVAGLLQADLLILLSDVDALYTAPPGTAGARPIDFVPYGDPLTGVKVGATNSGWGTGGALTKLAAARLAASSGCEVVLTATDLLGDLLSGSATCTRFAAADTEEVNTSV